ncbi:MAG: tetratricopeptide repeat protein [Candidatus Hydrogenedentes bacterium]|nr:tetratricopeptide repeat protein [Candidatus Hydrogenedentota bacterium]
MLAHLQDVKDSQNLLGLFLSGQPLPSKTGDAGVPPVQPPQGQDSGANRQNYVQIASLATGLPSVSDILATLSQTLAEPSSPAPQQTPTVTWPEGDNLRETGQYPQALSSYLAALEEYQGTPTAVYAEGEIGDIAELIAQGTASLSDLSAIEADLPPLESLSAQGQYAICSFYAVGCEKAIEVGSVEVLQRMAPTALRQIEAFAAAHPDDPFQVSTLGYYIETARALGPEQLTQCAARLNEIAEHGAAPMVRASAHAMLADYEAREHRSKAGAALHRASLLDEMRGIDLSGIYDDPQVYYWVKGWLGYYLAVAHSELGQFDEAEAALNQVVGYLTPGRHTYHMVAYELALLDQRRHREEIGGGSEAIWSFVQENPGSLLAPRALMMLANTYATAGDYDGAEQIYQTLLRDYSEAPEARAASDELAYQQENLLGTIQVARGLPEKRQDATQLAQLCGPKSLCRLFELNGKKVPLGHLAALSGARNNGASMAGLIQAAEKKGMTLFGVEAANLQDIEPPFIALLAGAPGSTQAGTALGHFVVVEACSTDQVCVYDPNSGDSTEPIDIFAKQWTGMALVPAGHNPQLALLDTATLDSVHGGNSVSYTAPEDEPGRWGVVPGEMGGPRPPGILPGSPAGPSAISGVDREGIQLSVDTFNLGTHVSATDLAVRTRGGMHLSFARHFYNPDGYLRAEFDSTSKPWMNSIGRGWTHSYNIFLRTSSGTTPSAVVLFDEIGAQRTYTYGSTSGGYDYYARDTGGSGEKLNVLKRDTTSLKWYWELGGGVLTYEFSAATTDSYRYARLEKIKDLHTNEITLSYDGAAGTGKLTKISSPAGDVQHIALTYTGNLITKAELKKNSTVLVDVDYTYSSDELITVTDADSNTIQYAYATDGAATGTRYISLITDKMDNDITLTWSFDLDANSIYRADSIELLAPNGLNTVYERSLSTQVATIRNMDGATQLSKCVSTPVTSDATRNRYQDYYVDATTYERWTKNYTTGDLTGRLAPGNFAITTNTFNSEGQLLTSELGDGGGTVEYTYTSGWASPDIVTGPDGLDTEFTFDANGKMTTKEHPSQGANTWDYTYDTYGQLESVTNPEGDLTEYTYDSVGNRLTIAVDPTGLNLITEYTYDDFGNRTTVTDPRGKTTTSTYDTSGCSGCGGGFGRLISVEDPLSNVTEYEYDDNGNQTKVTDALDRETDFAYDNMDRQTTVTSPSGSANTMTTAYGKLGLEISETDFEGVTTDFDYDHVGRKSEDADGEGTTLTVYTSFGAVDAITDGNGNTTTNTYDDNYRSKMTEDEIGKQVHYTYDSAGRLTEIGAGTTGSTDPTEYFYNAQTGKLETVRYHAGAGYDDAVYHFDSLGRLVEIDDWISAVAGETLEYAYDAAGRVTTLTDYDDETLSYAYDDAGNITSMTDYHGFTTSYDYDDNGRLETLTAPGSKIWSYYYNALNRPTEERLPNGMASFYTYDTLNRLEKIDHKDAVTGGNTVLSFDYTLDDNGNITRIDENDGGCWIYDYDARHRLTGAVYTTDWGHESVYAYTYDDGDNMTQKVEPFAEDFNDGNYTGWNVAGGGGSFSAANYYVANDLNTAGNSSFYLNRTAQDGEIRFSYLSEDTSSDALNLRVILRNNTNKRIDVRFYPSTAKIWEWDGDSWNLLDQEDSADTAEDTWYEVVCKLDGANVSIFRGPKGGALTEILSTTVSESTTNSQLWFLVTPNAMFRFDDVKIIDGTLHSTWTMTCNDANELTQMTNGGQGTTIDYAYDDWGRRVEKSIGSCSASYGYSLGSLISSIESSIPDELDSEIAYSGAKKIISIGGQSSIRYRYGNTIFPLHEEDEYGNPITTYIDITGGEFSQSDTSASGYKYILHRGIGRPSQLFNHSGQVVASTKYDPFGQVIEKHGIDSNHFGYLNFGTDPKLGLAPNRAYDTTSGRWLSRDPVDNTYSQNRYLYVNSNPISHVDPAGLVCVSCMFHAALWWNPFSGCARKAERTYADVAPPRDPGFFAFSSELGTWPIKWLHPFAPAAGVLPLRIIFLSGELCANDKHSAVFQCILMHEVGHMEDGWLSFNGQWGEDYANQFAMDTFYPDAGWSIPGSSGGYGRDGWCDCIKE